MITFINQIHSQRKQMDEDEVTALQSMYCLPGELEFYTGESNNCEVAVKIQDDVLSSVKLVFAVGPNYPGVPPEISVFCEALSKSEVKCLREGLVQYAREYSGMPMLSYLIGYVQEKLGDLQNEKEKASSKTERPGVDLKNHCKTLLVHIDHMRSRTQYVRTIRKWTEELKLVGRLIFCNRVILLLLQGHTNSVKEYLVRHKSVNIDVDSRGNPCKEKMMSVLCERICLSKLKFEDFQVTECSTPTQLKEIFQDCGLKDLYIDFVQTIKGCVT